MKKATLVAIFLALIIISCNACRLLRYSLGRRLQGTAQFTCLTHKTKPLITHQLLVANQNSTFTVPLTVVNNMGWTVQYQVLVKITPNLNSFPVNAPAAETYNMTLGNGQSWQKSVTVTENQVGSYSVVFELWQYQPRRWRHIPVYV